MVQCNNLGGSWPTDLRRHQTDLCARWWRRRHHDQVQEPRARGRFDTGNLRGHRVVLPLAAANTRRRPRHRDRSAGPDFDRAQWSWTNGPTATLPVAAVRQPGGGWPADLRRTAQTTCRWSRRRAHIEVREDASNAAARALGDLPRHRCGCVPLPPANTAARRRSPGPLSRARH